MKSKKFLILASIIVLFIIFLSGCIQKSIYMVPMSDGISLATDVYLPSKNILNQGAILIRTPYNKNLLSLIGNGWAKNGWPVVIQDMRGRFASEGIDTVFQNANTDGPDTLEWIATQSWSNGKVATFGGSALGLCQYYMAGANPPELKCQYIQVATPNLYKHGIYQGGEFRYQLIYKWLEGQGSLHVLPQLYENENFSLDVWTNVSLEDNWHEINVPAIHIGGWYDIFCQGTIDGFMGYQYKGGQGAQGKSKLIIGPWTHGGAKKKEQGQLVYPDNCIDNFSDDLFWNMVNEYIRGQSGDYDEWPSVYYYVMGDVDDINAPGNEWRSTNYWPPQSTDINWYFHENGLLSTSLPSSYNKLTYNYDPLDPIPTIGGQNLNLPSGPYDQVSIETRDDVIVFTSDVLNEPFEATGPIKAKLYVSSDRPDTDFTVKLTDVYPDGRSMLITDGILRMRNHNGSDHWEFMHPENIYEIEIDLWSTSYIWNTGHKIRVAISSSNYPRFLNNPNTKDPIAKNSTYYIAQNTVYLDDNYPSCIVLPKINPNKVDSNIKNELQIKDNLNFRENLRNHIQEFIENKLEYLSEIVLDPFVPFNSLK